MAKIQVIVAVLTLSFYFSDGYPLEADSESTQTSSHDLKVHPLLAGTTEQTNTETSSESGKNDDKNSTDGALIEETYIEVLLPGSPQVNSSALDSLLNGSVPKAVHESLSKRSTSDEDPADREQKKEPSTVKPVLYAHQNRAARDVSLNTSLNRTEVANITQEKNGANHSVPAILTHYPLSRPSRDTLSKSNAQVGTKLSDPKKEENDSGSKSTLEDPKVVNTQPVVPVLYSQQNHADRPARDISSDEADSSSSEEDDSSTVKRTEAGSTVEPVLYSAPQSQNKESSEENSSSSEEQTTKQPTLTRRYPAEVSSQQEPQQYPNNGRFARGTEDEPSTETSGSTETVVYITPEATKLPLN